jgi:hypothetical protein
MIAAGTFRPPRVRSIQRAWRLAYLKTIRDLRRSVALHRPISLPNLLRLYRRRLASAGLHHLPSAAQRQQRECSRLRELYHRQQPFTVRHGQGDRAG